MMKINKHILLGLMLFILPLKGFCQFLETHQLISINTGYGMLNGGEDNLFFPSSVNQSGLNIDLSYGHKITPWLAGGLSIGYCQFAGSNTNPGFAEIETDGSTFITAGPQIVLHSPYNSKGILNRIRMGLALIPQYHYYSGDRSLNVDNEVLPINDGVPIKPVIEMNSKSSGFGVKLSPEINCRITQRFGLRLAYNMQLLTVFTGFDQENMLSHSLTGGVLFTFGNSKQLF